MGYEATCTLNYAGRSAKGQAHLEQKDLVFRGPIKLSISFSDITSARAEGDKLHVTFKGKPAEFTIGAAPAEKWARRILNPPTRLDKLGVKPGMSVLCLSLRDDEFIEELCARGAEVSARRRTGADIIFYGAPDRGALDSLAGLVSSLKPDGALWVIRPKGVKAITEGEVMAAGRQAGLVDVKVVSFSETQTAEKFVIPRAERSKG
jgi:hypothetical protein